MTATTNGESMGRGKGEVLFSDEPFKTTGAAIGAGVLTGSLITCIMLVIAIIIGSALQGMDEGMAYCLSFIAAGIAGGVLQQLWFNLRATVLRLRYPLRLLGFSLSYYICLAACAFHLPRDPSGADRRADARVPPARRGVRPQAGRISPSPARIDLVTPLRPCDA